MKLGFIEYMPTQNSIGWDKDKFISSAEIKAKLMVFGKLYKTDHITGAGHAQYFKFQGALGTIGVISPVSNSFL